MMLESVIEKMNDVETQKDDVDVGWADAISKIFRKSSSLETTIVCKVKNKEDSEAAKEERKKLKKRNRKKRKWKEMCKVKPNVLDKDYEQNLRKIATKGVVQLFNAVQNHQKEIENKLKKAKTEGKREKVMKSVKKNDFLDLLDDKKKENKKDWKVVKDSLMENPSMKDWDKEDDDDVANDSS